MSSGRGVVAIVHASEFPQVAYGVSRSSPRASPEWRDAAIRSVTVHAAVSHRGAGLTRNCQDPHRPEGVTIRRAGPCSAAQGPCEAGDAEADATAPHTIKAVYRASYSRSLRQVRGSDLKLDTTARKNRWTLRENRAMRPVVLDTGYENLMGIDQRVLDRVLVSCAGR